LKPRYVNIIDPKMASSMVPTFVAAIHAVGTASTMAFAGFYLHRRGFVTASGKKMMALLSQQVTIPAFLFAKIIYCPPSGGSGGSNSIHNLYPSTTEDMQDPFDDMPEIVCPSVADRISDLWVLLLWPFYVVFCGLITGYLAARLTKTPPLQVRSCLAACAFGNSTGLVITLLSVIHQQFKNNTELGRIDPTALLSIYLLSYPVLQWGVGGWLLAPEDTVEDVHTIENGISRAGTIAEKQAGDNGNAEETHLLHYQEPSKNPTNGSDNSHIVSVTTHGPSFRISHLLNHEPQYSPAVAAGQEEFGGVRTRHFMLTNNENSKDQRWYNAGYIDSTSSALAMMMTELSFDNKLGLNGSLEELPSRSSSSSGSVSSKRNDSDGTYLQPQTESELESQDGPLTMDAGGEATAALDSFIADLNPPTIHEHVPFTNGHALPTKNAVKNGSNGNTLPRIRSSHIQSIQGVDTPPLTETLVRIFHKVFQPPVIGALLGLLIASFPNLRGFFQNIWGDEVRAAPMKWMFDGVYKVGQAAVPINMTILGINLSSTFQKKKPKKSSGRGDEHNDDDEKSKILPTQTMLAVVIGKMIVMPVIGIVSTWILQLYFIDFPEEIDATCFLVMMIVFITPTANNVMVMVELSGSSSKEGMARLIGWQYVVSPVVLRFVFHCITWSYIVQYPISVF